MSNKKQYWLDENDYLDNEAHQMAAKSEFAEDTPLQDVLEETDFELKSNRRDFLKYFGFSVSAVALASCNKAPIRYAIPYLVKPEEITPGVANFYSSTILDNSVGYGIEVKVRDGRPIKIDGSTRSSVSKGALPISGQAAILNLYDNSRLKNPTLKGIDTTWAKLDKSVGYAMEDVVNSGKKLAIVSPTMHSPSTLSVISEISGKIANTEHIIYDSVSYSGILDANEKSFGKRVIPQYNFGKADVIVSFGADFLGAWISPMEYTSDYMENRAPEGGSMSKHIQIESRLSITGSNADLRFPMKASNEAKHLSKLHSYISSFAGGNPLSVEGMELAGNSLKMAAADLWSAKGKALVVSGSNNSGIQQIVNSINSMLGAYGTTIDMANYSKQFEGSDAKFNQFVNDLKAGNYSGVIFYNTNPVFNHPQGKEIAAAIKKCKLSISCAYMPDETSDVCNIVAPDNHFLESWGDAEPKLGQYQFAQPTISRVYNTRQMQESLLTWAGIALDNSDSFAKKAIDGQKYETSAYYNYLTKFWAGKGVNGNAFNKCLHDGVYGKATATRGSVSAPSLANISSQLPSSNGGFDLEIFQNTAIQDGANANNPWAHETPDPVSKVTWCNYVAIPKAFAVSKGISLGDYVTVTANGKSIKLPALIQPGQANQTISIAMGYGRTVCGTSGKDRGTNVATLLGFANQEVSYLISGVKIEKASGNYELALSQTHHTHEGRDIIRETDLTTFNKGIKEDFNKTTPELYTLWKAHEYETKDYTGHSWGMAIDLNKCTGCSACVVSCHIENNVPVVGENEVRRNHEMHWLRIDRYFSFKNDNAAYFDKDNYDYEDGGFVNKEKGYERLEEIEGKEGKYHYHENIKVINQPVMCQHCDHAPCETVCPVLATTHSEEGLNQMTYNRCIGTKYCANNCPYKVRRFNWFRYNENEKFDFHFNNELGKMVINPDVTVRTRGVMEKCSFCVQKIQDSKLTAKRENRALKDGDVQTACQRACPTGAIVFGDRNNPKSMVRKIGETKRSYKLLEELDVQPAVNYLVKVRNV